jgi:hypothetical protein
MNGVTIFIIAGLFALIFILGLFLYYDYEDSNIIQDYDYDDIEEYYDNFKFEGEDFLNEMNKQGKVQKKTRKEDSDE